MPMDKDLMTDQSPQPADTPTVEPAFHDYSHEVRPAHSKPVRGLLIAVGGASAGLAVTALFAPLVPAMPFVVLAGACFARASDRFYNQLLNHPKLGPLIYKARTSDHWAWYVGGRTFEILVGAPRLRGADR
jgi:hypothetical protein